MNSLENTTITNFTTLYPFIIFENNSFMTSILFNLQEINLSYHKPSLRARLKNLRASVALF